MPRQYDWGVPLNAEIDKLYQDVDGTVGLQEGRLTALETEVAAAREGHISLKENLDVAITVVSTVAAGVATEVTSARNAYPNLDARLDATDNTITTLTTQGSGATAAITANATSTTLTMTSVAGMMAGQDVVVAKGVYINSTKIVSIAGLVLTVSPALTDYTQFTSAIPAAIVAVTTAEVASARKGQDGTLYNTLKARLDSEMLSNKTRLTAVESKQITATQAALGMVKLATTPSDPLNPVVVLTDDPRLYGNSFQSNDLFDPWLVSGSVGVVPASSLTLASPQMTIYVGGNKPTITAQNITYAANTNTYDDADVSGTIRQTPMPAVPAAPTLGGGAGTMDPGMYYYRMTATKSGGETLPGPEASYNVSALATPAAPTAGATQQTGGLLALKTRKYYLVATRLGGKTVPSAVASATCSGSNNAVLLTWGLIPTATGYEIYASDNGGTTKFLIATLDQYTAGYTDLGVVTSGAVPPSVNNTLGVSISNTTDALADGYKFYGRAANAEMLLATNTTPTYIDTGAVTPVGVIPTLEDPPDVAANRVRIRVVTATTVITTVSQSISSKVPIPRLRAMGKSRSLFLMNSL